MRSNNLLYAVLLLLNATIFVFMYLTGYNDGGAASKPHISLCEWEDGSGSPGKPCYWDAQHAGNGKGKSVLYWDGKTFIQDR